MPDRFHREPLSEGHRRWASNRQQTLPEIDPASVKQYWEHVKSSILGPYMMDGFGFPVSAGDFRFRAEARVVRRLLRGVEHNGAVLDLGSGVGYWAEEFARSFSRVVAVEGSNALYQALEERCAPYSNIRAIHGNVLSFEPDGHYNLVFLGGLLMYLDENDVIALLKKLLPCLGPDGIIVSRESTVRGETVIRTGDYPVVYRSVPNYKRLFKQCGLTLKHVERNEPYVLMQIGCELIKKWKRAVPESLQAILNSPDDITHRPCYASPVEFQHYRSVRVAAIYSFKEQSARCGVSDCLQAHRQGFLVIISDEKETNLCEACGQRFFDVRFAVQKKTLITIVSVATISIALLLFVDSLLLAITRR